MMRLLCFATSGHEKVDWIWMSGIRIGLSEVDFQADESIFHLFERIFNLGGLDILHGETYYNRLICISL